MVGIEHWLPEHMAPEGACNTRHVSIRGQRRAHLARNHLVIDPNVRRKLSVGKPGVEHWGQKTVR